MKKPGEIRLSGFFFFGQISTQTCPKVRFRTAFDTIFALAMHYVYRTQSNKKALI